MGLLPSFPQQQLGMRKSLPLLLQRPRTRSEPGRDLVNARKHSCTEQLTFYIRIHESMDAGCGDTSVTGVSRERGLGRVALGIYLLLQSTQTRDEDYNYKQNGKFCYDGCLG